MATHVNEFVMINENIPNIYVRVVVHPDGDITLRMFTYVQEMTIPRGKRVIRCGLAFIYKNGDFQIVIPRERRLSRGMDMAALEAFVGPSKFRVASYCLFQAERILEQTRADNF